jgi:hypothetical protein
MSVAGQRLRRLLHLEDFKQRLGRGSFDRELPVDLQRQVIEG